MSDEIRSNDEIELKEPINNEEQLNDIYYNEFLKIQDSEKNICLLGQEKITNRMRGILIDWLVEVSSDFKFKRTTLYLAAEYINRYLDRIKDTQTNVFQLLGISALFIAHKVEEVKLRSSDDFILATSKSYTKNQLFDEEIAICEVLNWNLLYVTPIMFLDCYFERIRDINKFLDNNNEISKNYLRCADLLDYVILDCKYLEYPPSHVVTSILYVFYDEIDYSGILIIYNS